MTTAPAVEPPVRIPVAVEALWLTSRLHPRLIPYNEVVSIRKHGPLDPEVLQEALNTLVRRYDAWHHVIDVVDGEPVLIPQRPAQFALAVIDLSELDAEAAERQAIRIVAAAAQVPYDLRRGPLIRPRLLRLSADEHRLYLAMHHAIFDGLSLARTVLPELIALYEALSAGGDPPPESPRAGYVDFARWEREWITSARAARRLDYWRGRLTPAPPRLSLPTDEPRPGTPALRGGSFPFRIPRTTTEALSATARSCGSTEFQACGAIWAALLHRLTGATDVTFATPANLRRRSEFAGLVGYCVSPLVIRVDLRDDPAIGELMTRVRNELLDGLDHLVPFERIVRDQNLGEADGANPVYQTIFVLQPHKADHDPAWTLAQLDSALTDAIGGAKLDLELSVDVQRDGSFLGQLNYDRDLFNPETAQRLIVAWCHMVEAVASDPGIRVSEIPLQGATHAGRLAQFNATTIAPGQGTAVQRFREVVAVAPQAPAVSAGGATLSYGELERAALAGASRLSTAGVGDGQAVAVCLNPSAELVAAALATQIAGAALVLLDPAEPPQTLAEQVSAAGCAAVIVAENDPAPFDPGSVPVLRWPGATDGAAPIVSAHAADLDLPCLLAPTPGHTGPDTLPYGPGTLSGGMGELSRGAVDTLVQALVLELDLGPGDTVLSLPEVLYASPVTELWPALLAGARLVIAPPDVSADGRALSKLISAEGVSLLHATPSRWQALIATGLRPARGLAALSGGEPLGRELADALLERCRVVWSAYAPAVRGGYVTLGRVADRGPVTIGRPFANHRAHVVDGSGRPVPIGFVGELWVAGPLVACDGPGSEALIAEPGGPGSARRTGQPARWLSDGRLALVMPGS